MSEAAIIAAIMGASEVVKKLGLNSKFIPVINLILGIVFCVAFSPYLTGDIRQDMFQGIIVGLSASGLYSGAKNVSEGITL